MSEQELRTALAEIARLNHAYASLQAALEVALERNAELDEANKRQAVLLQRARSTIVEMRRLLQTAQVPEHVIEVIERNLRNEIPAE